MSVTQTHVSLVIADEDRRTNDGGEITADPSARPADPMAVEQLIADVLGRAHRMAHDRNAPDEARAILHVAHAFADELAMMNPQFDRMRFIDAATTGPS
jgi:hypothetical protein